MIGDKADFNLSVYLSTFSLKNHAKSSVDWYIKFTGDGKTVIVAKPVHTMGPPFPLFEVSCTVLDCFQMQVL